MSETLEMGNHVQWAEDLLNQANEIYEENPSIVSALFLGAATAGVYIAVPARYTFDFFKRAVMQLAPIDLLRGVGAILVTLCILAVSPVIFVVVSVMMLSDIEKQRERIGSNERIKAFNA